LKRRPWTVSDEIAEHLAETIAEMTAQIDCQQTDRMVEIDSDTPETVPLTPRIEERYTLSHYLYYAETVAD
jgi:hypothetical protein